jgi:hypothetical protein
VNIQAPANDGGTKIIEYVVINSEGTRIASGNGLQITIDLPANTDERQSLLCCAVNSVGQGPGVPVEIIQPAGCSCAIQ